MDIPFTVQGEGKSSFTGWPVAAFPRVESSDIGTTPPSPEGDASRGSTEYTCSNGQPRAVASSATATGSFSGSTARLSAVWKKRVKEGTMGCEDGECERVLIGYSNGQTSMYRIIHS